MAQYQSYSPFARTQTVNDQYLDLLSIRPIPATADDVLYTVEPQYTHRPDLLAYDLYNNTQV